MAIHLEAINWYREGGFSVQTLLWMRVPLGRPHWCPEYQIVANLTHRLQTPLAIVADATRKP